MNPTLSLLPLELTSFAGLARAICLGQPVTSRAGAATLEPVDATLYQAKNQGRHRGVRAPVAKDA